MPLYALGDAEPVIHPDAYVQPDAVVIGDRALISSGSVVLDGATVGEGPVVAVGAVVAPNTRIPPAAMALGVPARARAGYRVPAGADANAVEGDVQRGKRFRAELRRLG